MSKVYHYTSTAGFLGIVNDSSIWATNIFFLNDYQEMKKGIDYIRKNLKDENLFESMSQDYQKIIERLQEISIDHYSLEADVEISLTNYLLEMLVGLSQQFYITSFTHNKDYLRQWTSYCEPNDGICIEFDEHVLSESFKYNKFNRYSQAHHRFDSIIYSYSNSIRRYFDKHKIREVFLNRKQSLVNNVRSIREHSAVRKTDTEYRYNATADLLFSSILEALTEFALIRNPQFSDEKEKRLILTVINQHDKSIKFRSRSGVIIPYIPVHIDLKSITKVIISPTNDATLRRKGIELLRGQYNLNFDICESECQLRKI